MYEVILSSEALIGLCFGRASFSKENSKVFGTTGKNPSFHPNIKTLKGDFAGYYRYRIGDYRVFLSDR